MDLLRPIHRSSECPPSLALSRGPKSKAGIVGGVLSSRARGAAEVGGPEVSALGRRRAAPRMAHPAPRSANEV
eukprot:10970767-Alexandrium_andersonii.AAC.1